MNNDKYFDLTVFLNKDGFDDMDMDRLEIFIEYTRGLVDWLEAEKRRKETLQRILLEL